MLSVQKLCKDYPTRNGDLTVLKDCSFEIHEGESLAITGPSGTGKSTLLSILGTLEPPTSGRVFLNDTNVLEIPAQNLPAFRRHQIGFVFQDHHLLPQCSALENVLMPFLAEGHITNTQREQGLSLLEKVGLSSRLKHRPAELSGGERQRVAIARALVYAPALLLADEPTGNLDRQTAERVGDLLMSLAENTMLVLVTHDSLLAARATKKLSLAEEK